MFDVEPGKLNHIFAWADSVRIGNVNYIESCDIFQIGVYPCYTG